MEFHEKLQELRKRRGLTQEELAEILCVSRTAVSKWESGRGYPNLDSLKALAHFYGVTVDELLSGEALITLACEDSRRQQARHCDLVFGLLDIAALLLFLLPLFALQADGAVRSVPLTALSGWLMATYCILAAGLVLVGILTLALQTCTHPLWVRCKAPLSLLIHSLAVALFILSRQPYPALLLFLFLMIKALTRKVSPL